MSSGDNRNERPARLPLSPAFPFNQLQDWNDPDGAATLLEFNRNIRIPRVSSDYRDLLAELAEDPDAGMREVEAALHQRFGSLQEAALACTELINLQRIGRVFSPDSSSPPPEEERYRAALFYGTPDPERASWHEIIAHMVLYHNTREMLMEATDPANGQPLTVNQMLAAANSKPAETADEVAARLLGSIDFGDL